MAYIMANLAAGVEVDENDRIVHYDSRTGLADPNAGGWNYDFPDTADNRLPVPPTGLCSDLPALLDAMDEITVPPIGFSELPEAFPVTAEDPGMQFGMTNVGWLSQEKPFLNWLRHSNDNKSVSSDTFINDLTLSEVDANGDIVGFAPGDGAYQEVVINHDAGSSPEADAYWNSSALVLIWVGTGNINARTEIGGAFASSSGSGSGKIATLGLSDSGRLGYVQITATPVKNRKYIQERWVDLEAAGCDFNPDTLRVYREPRICRFMDFHFTNHNGQVTELSHMADRAFNGSWAWESLTNFPSYGPPLAVMVEWCNLTRTDMWYCLPHHLSDQAVADVVNYINANLASDLVVYIENTNEPWNNKFGQYVDYEVDGIALYNKATLAASDTSSGYSAGDIVNGGGWTVMIDAVDGGGKPTDWRVTDRTPTDNSDVAMTGGDGTGLVMDFESWFEQDFPSYWYYGFRSAQIADIIRTEVGGDFNTRVRMVFGTQTGSGGRIVQQKQGFDHWADGMNNGTVDHPDYSPVGATGDEFSDLFFAVAGTNYNGPTLDAIKLATLDALTSDQDTFNAQCQAWQAAALVGDIINAESIRAWCDGESVSFLGYEGGSHFNISAEATNATLAGLKAYHRSDVFLAQQAASWAAYQLHLHMICDFNLIGQDESGNPWYALDFPADENDPRFIQVKAKNREIKGSTWDAGRTGGFGVGPYHGVNVYDGSVGGDSSPLIIGGRMSIIQGDHNNVVVMPREGIVLNAKLVVLPGSPADYSAAKGPNGCLSIPRAGETIRRLHPTNVPHVRFENSFAKVAPGTL